MNVICFGDSNTYGYDPRTWLGDRYAPDSRWADLLAAETGWSVCNMWVNGRQIPHTAPVFPTDTDLLILMLGTNDLLRGKQPEQAIAQLENFVSQINLEREKLLLIAPPPVTLGEWVPHQTLIDHSKQFAQCCRSLARQMDIPFADAGDWNISLAYDGVHFTEQGHKAFAAGRRCSDETNVTLAVYLLAAVLRLRRKQSRQFLSANYAGRSQGDDGHPGSSDPGCTGAGRI